MPFIDLASRDLIDEDRLNDIVRDLEKDGLVRRTNADDLIEDIVTVTREGLGKCKIP
jgi:DNA-binding MarR family transcriptional regulator